LRLLLDTSIFLWWLDDDRRLGPTARAVIADPGNEVFVSSVTAWEISVKRASGKLEAAFDVAAAINDGSFIPLPIDVAHAVAAGELPKHHKDPFDRMLIVQAQLEGLTLVTEDEEIGRYDVELFDARA
jgi:PIN domain nuclease of toxin-antitoxin system